jgi:ACT domain-containing protein
LNIKQVRKVGVSRSEPYVVRDGTMNHHDIHRDWFMALPLSGFNLRIFNYESEIH